MTLHLVKLCVGPEQVSDLVAYVRLRRAQKQAAHDESPYAHVTRMTPKRIDELLDGGSLYWVVKGQIAARQKLLGVEPFVDGEGVSRCRLLLDDTVHSVAPRSFRPFQGWRYLNPADAPPDLATATGAQADMPEAMRRDLSALGLL